MRIKDREDKIRIRIRTSDRQASGHTSAAFRSFFYEWDKGISK